MPNQQENILPRRRGGRRGENVKKSLRTLCLCGEPRFFRFGCGCAAPILNAESTRNIYHGGAEDAEGRI
jgi:hypothetical protein